MHWFSIENPSNQYTNVNKRFGNLVSYLMSPRLENTHSSSGCSLPPTFQTWFTVTNLHIWLLTVRLRALPKPHGYHYVQGLVNHFFEDVEVQIRSRLHKRVSERVVTKELKVPQLTQTKQLTQQLPGLQRPMARPRTCSWLWTDNNRRRACWRRLAKLPRRSRCRWHRRSRSGNQLCRIRKGKCTTSKPRSWRQEWCSGLWGCWTRQICRVSGVDVVTRSIYSKRVRQIGGDSRRGDPSAGVIGRLWDNNERLGFNSCFELSDSYLHPLTRFPQYCQQLSLLRILVFSHVTHVLPSCYLWQTHQNTLNSGSWCLQAEFSAPVVHQVKLYITSPPQKLPSPLFFVPRCVFSSF